MTMTPLTALRDGLRKAEEDLAFWRGREASEARIKYHDALVQDYRNAITLVSLMDMRCVDFAFAPMEPDPRERAGVRHDA